MWSEILQYNKLLPQRNISITGLAVLIKNKTLELVNFAVSVSLCVCALSSNTFFSHEWNSKFLTRKNPHLKTS